MIYLRIGRFWVKKKNSEEKILFTTFSKSGGGYLGAKNQNFKNCPKHDFFANWPILSQKKFWSKNLISLEKFFCPFFRFLRAPKSPKNQNFEKLKKMTPDIFLRNQGGVRKKSLEGMVENPPRREILPTHPNFSNLGIFFPANFWYPPPFFRNLAA